MAELNMKGVNLDAVERAEETSRLAERAAGLNEGWQREFVPRVLPAGWRMVNSSPEGAAFTWQRGLTVMLSAAMEQDGRRWLHVSASALGRVPTWEELKLVKAIFVGPKRYAYQVLPSEDRYVNINPHVLHLFACLDDRDNPMPDFTRGTGAL